MSTRTIVALLIVALLALATSTPFVRAQAHDAPAAEAASEAEHLVSLLESGHLDLSDSSDLLASVEHDVELLELEMQQEQSQSLSQSQGHFARARAYGECRIQIEQLPATAAEKLWLAKPDKTTQEMEAFETAFELTRAVNEAIEQNYESTLPSGHSFLESC
jgi:hypothetical protein